MSVAGTPRSTAQAPDSNAALIGGIVGGIVALLLVVGLIAFFVARSRRNVNHGTTAPPTAQSTYGRLPSQTNNVGQVNTEYDDVDVVRSTSTEI
jgi:hypothetical protein